MSWPLLLLLQIFYFVQIIHYNSLLPYYFADFKIQIQFFPELKRHTLCLIFQFSDHVFSFLVVAAPLSDK